MRPPQLCRRMPLLYPAVAIVRQCAGCYRSTSFTRPIFAAAALADASPSMTCLSTSPKSSSRVAERSRATRCFAAAGQGRRVPHTSIRKRIAERMVESLLHTAPHVTTIFEVDLGAVLAHRAQHRADFEQRGASLTLTAYFLAACVDAIREVPEVNSRWTDDALEIYDNIDIGVGDGGRRQRLGRSGGPRRGVAGSVRNRARAVRSGCASARRQAHAARTCAAGRSRSPITA